MFKFLKNKGGFGKSLTRSETVSHFSALIQRQNEINYAYDFVVEHLANRDLAERLSEQQRTARIDAGKLSETILSAAGTPPLGTDIEPGSVNLGDDDEEMLRRLSEMEKALYEEVEAERKLRHMMRSLAVLENVARDSKARLDFLEQSGRGLKRGIPAG